MELQRLKCRVMKRTHTRRLHRGQRCMAWTAAHSPKPELLSLSPAASAASHALPTDVRDPHSPPQPASNVSCGLQNPFILNADVIWAMCIIGSPMNPKLSDQTHLGTLLAADMHAQDHVLSGILSMEPQCDLACCRWTNQHAY